MAISKISFKRLGEWIPISLPYTAQSDGFIYAYCNPKTVSGGYSRVTVGKASILTSCPNGEPISNSLPVKKGETVTNAGSSNVTVTLKFCSLGGGNSKVTSQRPTARWAA